MALICIYDLLMLWELGLLMTVTDDSNKTSNHRNTIAHLLAPAMKCWVASGSQPLGSFSWS